MTENLLCDIIETLSSYFDKLYNTKVNKKISKTEDHNLIQVCPVLICCGYNVVYNVLFSLTVAIDPRNRSISGFLFTQMSFSTSLFSRSSLSTSSTGCTTSFSRLSFPRPKINNYASLIPKQVSLPGSKLLPSNRLLGSFKRRSGNILLSCKK